MLTKYRFNQLLWLVNLLIFSSLWFLLWQNSNYFKLGQNGSFFSFETVQKLTVGVVIVIMMALSLHYFMNLVHLASHRLLGGIRTNRLLGNLAAILCGLTLADFTSTHLLHHRHVHQQKADQVSQTSQIDSKELPQDPDELISQAPHFVFLPFLIFWHDVYFWRMGLWHRGLWLGYCLDRLTQILLVTGFWYFDHLNLWLVFWLLPIYLVGFFNGLFLFYFPHYTTLWEEKRRLILDNLPASLTFDQSKLQTQEETILNLSEKMESEISNKSVQVIDFEMLSDENLPKSTGPKTCKINFLDQFLLEIINISRHFHRLHHQSVANNWAYFPIFSYLSPHLAKLKIYQLIFLKFKVQSPNNSFLLNKGNPYQFVRRKKI